MGSTGRRPMILKVDDRFLLCLGIIRRLTAGGGGLRIGIEFGEELG